MNSANRSLVFIKSHHQTLFQTQTCSHRKTQNGQNVSQVSLHHCQHPGTSNMVVRAEPKPKPTFFLSHLIHLSRVPWRPSLDPTGWHRYLPVWYGAFSLKDRTTITDFLLPSVLRASFPVKNPVSRRGGELSLLTKTRLMPQFPGLLDSAQIGSLVNKNIVISNKLPVDSNAIYLVLTAKDVNVEKFCMDSCGFHDSVLVTPKGSVIVYAHVGDAVQCPGFCAWPYAVPAYGPPGQALVAPNGVGADGMVINIATILAGAATNPFKSWYFQGDVLAPLEAVSACPGIFDAGAYPGYPGNLMVDKFSKASYNVYGANGEKFLLPAVWDLVGLTCKVV
ncbi:protein EXORDIUM [Salix suchowensis]|nr:protein EXORDIUM [Salix suchowensis]